MDNQPDNPRFQPFPPFVQLGYQLAAAQYALGELSYDQQSNSPVVELLQKVKRCVEIARRCHGQLEQERDRDDLDQGAR
jgi:hypothetical protein